jgi:hypothetical protein
MSKLSDFFKHSDSKMGVFYPTGYLIATFPDFAAASGAHQALLSSGHPDSDQILSTGQEVLDYFEEFRQESGTLGALMRPISRFIGTEVINSDVSIEQAQHGAGFIAILCPSEADALRIRESILRYQPTSADWYLSGGIQSML